MPIAWLSFFMRLPFSLIRQVSSLLPLCLADGYYCSPFLASTSTQSSDAWLSVGNRCYSGWMPFYAWSV